MYVNTDDNQDKLYSIEFQREVVYSLATNVVFAANYGCYLISNNFDTIHLQTIFKIIYDHVLEYETEIDLKDVLIKVEDHVTSKGWGNESLKALADEAKAVFRIRIKNEIFIKDQVVKFCRQQAIKHAFLRGSELLELGRDENYEEIVKLFNSAISVGSGMRTSRTMKDLYNLPEEYRRIYNPANLIKTGFKKFDQALMGGMAKGELHVIIGGPKCLIGNTRISLLNGTDISMYELHKSGKKEFWLYSCLPDGTIIPGKGHDCRITGYTSDLVMVILDNGNKIVTTPEHLHMKRDGTYVEAQSLKPGDSMMPLYKDIEKEDFLKGYEYISQNSTGQKMFTHRLVMNTVLEGYTANKTHTHHRDKNKLNNDPSNLMSINKYKHQNLHKEDQRDLMLSLWEDPEFINAHHESLIQRNLKNWQNENYRLKMTEALKRGIETQKQDPDYHEKCTERGKSAYTKDPSLREKKSQHLKDLWENEEFRKMHNEVTSRVMKNNWNNPEFRESNSKATSERLKNKWQDPDYRESQKNRHFSEDARNRQSKAVSNAHKDPVYHKNIVLKRCDILLESIKLQGLELNESNYEKERLSDLRKYNGIPQWIIYSYYKNEFKEFGEEHDRRLKRMLNDIKNKNKREKRSKLNESKESFQYNHKVISVEFLHLEEPVPVYDITVDDYHNFALSAGIFTHNSGKSTFGCNIGVNCLVQRKTVFHATMELQDYDVLKHYALRFTGIQHTDFLNTPTMEWEAKMKLIKKLQAKLFVNYWTMNSINTLEIRSWITREKTAHGVHPDVIIVDYDDLLIPIGGAGNSGSSTDMYEDSGRIYTDLIQLADYFNCFTGDTLVMTSDNPVPIRIDQFKKNQVLNIHCMQNGVLRQAPAIALGQCGISNRIITITLDTNEQIQCTPDHKIMKADYNIMTEAQNIKIGDDIRSIDWYANKFLSKKAVINIQEEYFEEGVSVYCINVPKHGNFALGNGVIVSNCPVITFAQGKRECWDKPDRDEIINAQDLAHSARKAHKAHSISSLNFKKDSKKGTLYLDMCRRGQSGVYIALERDLSKSYMSEKKVLGDNDDDDD